MKVLALIPARFASTRFPGKPLVKIGKKTMVQRVCEQVSKAKSVDALAVVTDDERIFSHVQSIGYQVFMSNPEHQSGTDRCAEVAALLPDYDIIVNVQGDEPFILPEQIDLVANLFHPPVNPGGPNSLSPEGNETQIGTLVKKITTPEKIFNPNIVKAVFDKTGKALYFSRSPIPFLRGIAQEKWAEENDFYKHIGIYAFRRNALLTLAKLPTSVLEKAESLEQLRWLENGFSIKTAVTDSETFGIDTPDDLEKAEQYLSTFSSEKRS